MASTIRKRTDVRRFGPKEEQHPSLGTKCGKCGVAFAVGDYTALLTINTKDLTPNVAIVEAEEQHWACAVSKADGLVTHVVIDTFPAFDLVDIYTNANRAGTIVVAKGDGAAIADRLLCDPPTETTPKPSAPPPPLGDWRAHLRYAIDYEPDDATPKMAAETRRELLRTAEKLDLNSSLLVTTSMLHQWAAVLEVVQRLARGTKEPLSPDQLATMRNTEEAVRRATVAFLAIVAERSRSYS